MCDVASGVDHVLSLTKSGQVFTFGCAEQGRLGRMIKAECDAKTHKGDKVMWKSNILAPTKVGGLSDIATIGCGAYGSFAITSSSQVYAWGLNQYGQLGIEAEGDSAAEGDTAFFAPKAVPSLNGKRIQKIFGGEHHTFALTEAGGLLSFGRPTYGRLGRQDVNPKKDARHWQPAAVHGFNAIKVVHAAAAGQVSGAVTADGQAFAWGSGGDAMTGKPEGDEEDEHLPRLIEGLKGVLAIGFGGQHAALLVSSEAAGGAGQSNKRQR